MTICKGDAMTGVAASIDFRHDLPVDARILVTGGSGFIGTNLVAAYRKAGVTVFNADLRPPRNGADRDVWRATDLTKRDQVDRLFSTWRPTHVFHLGARTDLLGKTLADYAANIKGVSTMLGASRATASVERLVVASSRMVCHIGYRPLHDTDFCPSTLYGASKVETERLVRDADDLPWTMARPTSIWGPWFDVPYRDFFINVSQGRYLHPRGQRIPKHFGYVGNTVWQLHRLMTGPDKGVLHRIFYLADDPPIEVSDLGRRISVELGRRPPREVPITFMRSIARAGDLLELAGGKAPITTFRLDNLMTPMLYDLEAIKALTGPLPFTLETSVPDTVQWLRYARLI